MNTLFSSILLQTAPDTSNTSSSAMKFITGGGGVGYVIVLMSIVAFAFVLINLAQIRRNAMLPPEKLKAVREMVERGDLEGALEYSTLPANDCYFLRVVGSGLKRFLGSPFGAFEIKAAIEEAGAEETARFYRSLDVIGTIGSLAPLLGLLGTVRGMIGAFETVATGAANNANYYQELASNISIKLICTFQGLVVAILCVAMYSFLRNRVDALASECASSSEDLVMLVEKSGRKSGK